MKLSGLIIETSTVHSTKSARPLSIVKFVFLCDNDLRGRTEVQSGKLSCVSECHLWNDPLWEQEEIACMNNEGGSGGSNFFSLLEREISCISGQNPVGSNNRLDF